MDGKLIHGKKIPLHDRIPRISWANIHQSHVFPYGYRRICIDMLNIHGSFLFTISSTPSAATATLVIDYVMSLLAIHWPFVLRRCRFVFLT